MMKKIIIAVEHGVAKVIKNPSKFTIVIRDYDIVGNDKKRLKEDKKGNTYFEHEYKAE